MPAMGPGSRPGSWCLGRAERRRAPGAEAACRTSQDSHRLGQLSVKQQAPGLTPRRSCVSRAYFPHPGPCVLTYSPPRTARAPVSAPTLIPAGLPSASDTRLREYARGSKSPRTPVVSVPRSPWALSWALWVDRVGGELAIAIRPVALIRSEFRRPPLSPGRAAAGQAESCLPSHRQGCPRLTGPGCAIDASRNSAEARGRRH